MAGGGSGTVKGSKSQSLPDKVAQIYYSHGLLCSSYPTTIITIAVAVVLVCCYPLVNLPMPAHLPLQVKGDGANSSVNPEEPWCYVQQIVLRSAVLPWTSGLIISDAFRAPLYEAFKLLEVIRNYQHPNSSKTLAELCLHVEAAKVSDVAKYGPIFPEYNCLILSPANLWHQDVHRFSEDPQLLTTIFTHQNIQKGKISMTELLFGMNLKETGIKRYPLRTRQRVVQYAVTLVFKELDLEFIDGLRQKLYTMYPLHQDDSSNASTSPESAKADIIHIYYPGKHNYWEFVPMGVAFAMLFLYVYFSVRKIEVVQSKSGIAFCAVLTTLFSLLTCGGICFFFGLPLHGKEIFPYLVILVGLENVLVLTKSVVSTAQHLDVKIRVAQGLSREGWSITKNIMVEITILTAGLFTFVPVIQEFCIFAIVGLLSDFFLQMLFFSPVLALDMRRRDIIAEKYSGFRSAPHHPLDPQAEKYPSAHGLIRSKSHPRLSAAVHTNVLASQTQAAQEKRIPKRLRLVNIWARTRFFQRCFMAWMIVWISMIVYNSGVVEHFISRLDQEKGQRETVAVVMLNQSQLYPSKLPPSASVSSSPPSASSSSSLVKSSVNYVTQRTVDLGMQSERTHTQQLQQQHQDNPSNSSDDLFRLKHPAFSPWVRLSTQHWPTVFDKYNMSLSGSYVAILPSIRISHIVEPEQAILLRNSEEKDAQKFQWNALAAALDPLDFTDSEAHSPKPPRSFFSHIDTPFYPSSPMEIFLLTILCIISVVVLAYAMVVLYRCICSRNYAEWRASWSSEKNDEPVSQLVLEAHPTVVDGHAQDIECLVSDGCSVVSCCLGGQIKVWDPTTGEALASIDRRSALGAARGSASSSGQRKSSEPSAECDENGPLSDYESGSPPSRDETTAAAAAVGFPTLHHLRINTNFASLQKSPSPAPPSSSSSLSSSSHARNASFDFGACFREVFAAEETQIPRQPEGTDGQRYPRVPPVWCLDAVDNLIAIGCADGRLEFWEGTTGKLKCVFDDGSGTGLTSIKLIGSRVVAAKLNGSLDFLQLQSYNKGKQIDWGFTSAYRRTHVRTGSTGSIMDSRDFAHNGSTEDLRCVKFHTVRAHQQPITAIDAEGGRVLTGSQDHTLKVFRLEDANALYTLHGHCGPITCIFIDRFSPMTAGTGSQDGLLCVWDLQTGTCMYSIQAHDGSVTSLAYSASYVISLGTDEKLCVWERFQGHLLKTIQLGQTYTSGILMLTHHLVVTSRQGSLVVLDVRTGDTVRIVSLGHQDNCVFIKHMLLLRDAVACDYGTQLRIVRFPLITHKFD